MKIFSRPFSWTSKKIFKKGFRLGMLALASSMLLFEGTRAGNLLYGKIGNKHHGRTRTTTRRVHRRVNVSKSPRRQSRRKVA